MHPNSTLRPHWTICARRQAIDWKEESKGQFSIRVDR
jgi:hypothetical protein